MVTKLPRRTSATGPALVRLLSRLAQVEAQAPDAPLAASLNQWLGWSESIVLSTALNAPMPKPAGAETRKVQEPAAEPAKPLEPGADTAKGSAAKSSKEHDRASEIVDEAELARAEYAQLQTSLSEAIRLAVAPPAPLNDRLRRQMRPTAQTAEADFPTHRRRYVAAQQKMETSVAAARARLRAILAARSQKSARLAAVDAAMEQALAPHEQRLLAEIPNLLERRFQGLRQPEALAASVEPAERKGPARNKSGPERAAEAGQTNSTSESAVPLNDAAQPSKRDTALKAQPNLWLETFRDDMQSVLTAELDLRLEPIQGLLATLTTGPQR